MSIMTPEQAALRCAAAGEMQEIAVFRSHASSEMVDAVFERTVETQRWIRTGSRRLIGIFGGSDQYHEILKEIRKCLRKP